MLSCNWVWSLVYHCSRHSVVGRSAISIIYLSGTMDNVFVAWAYDVYQDLVYVRVGDPDRGVPLAAGVFAPEGPKEAGGPTSPCEPSGPNELMYALFVSGLMGRGWRWSYLKKCRQDAFEGVK
jgi:hypothetical protein